MKNIVILASGSGSNYQFITETISKIIVQLKLNIKIDVLMDMR